MNGQYYEDHFKPSDNVEGTDKEINNPVVNSDPFADKDPVDPALVHETPMGGTVAAVGPMNWSAVEEKPLGDTPVDETPRGGTIAAVGVMDEMIILPAPEGETIPHPAPAAPIAASPAVVPLLTHEDSEHFRTHWNEVQGKFVDDPRAAVQEADALVTEVIDQIAQMFAKEHSSLEGQWKQGNDVSTEELRKALQRYRSFFNRLVV